MPAVPKKPFRFGAGIPGILPRQTFIDTVRETERLGYSTLLLSDHLVDQFAPFSALGVAAGVTTTLRLGTFVLNNDCATRPSLRRNWPRSTS